MGLFGGPARAPELLEELEDGCGQEERTDRLPESHTNTVIAKDLTVTGTLQGDGVVQIEGTVEGEISLRGYVIVAATGVVRGPIEAEVIRIAGSVEGDLTAHDHLRLEKTGSVVGNVTTVSLIVEEGGWLNGRTTMVRTAATPQTCLASGGEDLGE